MFIYRLKNPPHPILFAAIVFTFALTIVVYLLSVACLLELNYLGSVSVVLGGFLGFLPPATIYAWKQGPATTHQLFEKYVDVQFFWIMLLMILI